MGTAGGATLIAGLTASFLYQHLGDWIAAAGVRPEVANPTALWSIAGFLLLFALLVFWLMNKATNADFLIATDSEMKKVNWTSRKELIGSTKVVIFFMFLIANFLLLVDVLLGHLFYMIVVLKDSPFGGGRANLRGGSGFRDPIFIHRACPPVW